MENNVSNISTARARKLKYLLLPGHELGASLSKYHNSAYQLWKGSWLKTYSDLKTAATLKADDFTRQNIISVLFDGDEAVSLLLHTSYNLELEAIRDHSYIASYPAEIVSRLRSEGRINVLSFEYLTLSHKWRKSVVDVPIAKIIIGLGVKIVEASGLNAIAVTRVDRSVNEMFSGFGARILAPNLTMHNVAVDLMMLNSAEAHPNPDPEVNELVELLWHRRTDLVGLEQLAVASRVEKKAA